MAVSKRLRFEILRRDEFRCYYCGTRGNEVTGEGLTIDHVVPVALGGTDDAENLVAACGDCNAGKTSVPADAALVAAVDQMTSVYRAARKTAMAALETKLLAEEEFTAQVFDVWDSYAPSYYRDPEGLSAKAADWFTQGVPLLAIHKGFEVAFAHREVGKASKLAYAAGVIRNLTAGAEDDAQSIADGNNVIWNAGYDAGFKDGMTYQRSREDDCDLVALHIDGRQSDFWKVMAGGS